MRIENSFSFSIQNTSWYYICFYCLNFLFFNFKIKNIIFYFFNYLILIDRISNCIILFGKSNMVVSFPNFFLWSIKIFTLFLSNFLISFICFVFTFIFIILIFFFIAFFLFLYFYFFLYCIWIFSYFYFFKFSWSTLPCH